MSEPEQPTLSARLGYPKHGPGDSGLAGPCDADCAKCEAEAADRFRVGDYVQQNANPPTHYRGHDTLQMAPGDVLLQGPLAVAYRALEAATKRALAGQHEIAEAGAAMRAAIGTLCRAMAPSPQSEARPGAGRGDE
jgi:hypothetical protein